MPSENEVRPAMISIAIFLNDFVDWTCEKALLAAFVAAIAAGRTSFLDFENDVKILFSECQNFIFKMIKTLVYLEVT